MKENLDDRIKQHKNEIVGYRADGDIAEIIPVEGEKDMAVVRYRVEDGKVWFGITASYDKIYLTKELKDGTFVVEKIVGLWTRPSDLIVKSARYDSAREEVELEIVRERFAQVRHPWAVSREELYKAFKVRCSVHGDEIRKVECEDEDPLPPL